MSFFSDEYAYWFMASTVDQMGGGFLLELLQGFGPDSRDGGGVFGGCPGTLDGRVADHAEGGVVIECLAKQLLPQVPRDCEPGLDGPDALAVGDATTSCRSGQELRVEVGRGCVSLWGDTAHGTREASDIEHVADGELSDGLSQSTSYYSFFAGARAVVYSGSMLSKKRPWNRPGSSSGNWTVTVCFVSPVRLDRSA